MGSDLSLILSVSEVLLYQKYCIIFNVQIKAKEFPRVGEQSYSSLTNKPVVSKGAGQLPAAGLIAVKGLVLCFYRENEFSPILWGGQRYSSLWEQAKYLTFYFPGFWNGQHASLCRAQRPWESTSTDLWTAVFQPSITLFANITTNITSVTYCKPQVFPIVRQVILHVFTDWLSLFYLWCATFSLLERYVSVLEGQPLNRVYRAFHCRQYRF